MAAHRPELTLAFLAHAPEAAAQVLERLDADEAAALFAATPARLAAPVLRHMHSFSGARCLEQLEPHAAAGLIRRIAFHDAASLLRLLSPAGRRALLEELPTRLAQRLKRALGYPVGSVGAWLDPDVPSFSAGAAVEDAVRYLAGRDGVSHVFVHDEPAGRFRGAVSIGRLLQYRAEITLADAGIREVRPLSSRASLASALAHPGWHEFLLLPVVSRKGGLVGGLSRTSLAAGLAEGRVAQRRQPASVPVQLTLALGIAWTGLLGLLFTAQADDRTS